MKSDSKKRGFTLTEILGAIIILMIISAIIIPIITNTTKKVDKKTYSIFEKNIKTGASLYLNEFPNSIYWVKSNENENEEVSCIALSKLKNKGYFTGELIDPNTKENYDSTKMVKATRSINTKLIEYSIVSYSECEAYKLEIVLKNKDYGTKENPLEYKEKYKEYGATAHVGGVDISDKIQINYKGLSDGQEVTVLGNNTYATTYSIDITDEFQNFTEEIVRTIYVADQTIPTIKLRGNPEIKLLFGNEFQDPGVELSDNYDSESTLTSKLTINNPVKTNVEGTYTLTYKLTDSSGNKAKDVTRKVIVKKIPVVLALKESTYGTASKPLTYKSKYQEYGATASVDGIDVSNQIKITYKNLANGQELNKLGNNTYTATYSIDVTNDYGRFTKEIVRTINVVDKVIPKIALKGSSRIVLPIGTAYIEPGLTLSDNYDSVNTLNSRLITTNLVNNMKKGTYYIYYEVSDSSGNQAVRIQRQVDVINNLAEIIKFKNNCSTNAYGCWPSPVATNNYVSYSNILWRYYRINNDNSIKLITNSSTINRGFAQFYCQGCCNAGVRHYNSLSTTNHGYTQFSTRIYNYLDQGMSNYLLNNFYNSLPNKTYIKNQTYCEGTSTPCTNPITQLVALIEKNEYETLYNSGNNFLKNNTNWWTMTPCETAPQWRTTNGYYGGTYGVYVVGANGALSCQNNSFETRPVITVNANTTIVRGDGTANNPYVIG